MAVVSECKQAVKKLKETNVYVIYKNISDATKKTIETVSNVTQPYWKRVPKKSLMVCGHLPFKE